MSAGQTNLQLCGFGGQGIVLAAVIFGTTAVTKAGMNAVQTQSYGSEARGGECQAEVIVSNQTIESPAADMMDILLAMSQAALDKYLPRLRLGGTLIFDPEFVEKPDRSDITKIEVSATQIAGEIGLKLAANMVMLGYLQEATRLFSAANLLDVVRENVPKRFVDLNLQAVKHGIALAKDNGTKVESKL
jgi:2-oxoglutarate ferredoxin oxidoreductase subunit gamma